VVNEQHVHVREKRVTDSMLWAGWADALGFITELTDEAGLRRRLRGEQLRVPVAWRRRVGGRGGVEALLPAGCYSDDTQLRLATARAISGKGFDAEAFAQVELAVWPAYALGGGRASKNAAANLARSGAPWYGNFYDGWVKSGGNGAAMRIQPHVWAAARPAEPGPHLTDVITNAVTTHGHPRGIVGAVLHALGLGFALEHGQVPEPEQWPKLLDMTEQTLEVIEGHPHLAGIWLPAWEKAQDAAFAQAWRTTIGECRDLLEPAARAAEALRAAPDNADGEHRSIYETLIVALGLAAPATSGSGTATVIASLALSAGLPGRLHDAVLLAARALGTDTDTIATMTAAVTAATGQADPLPSPVLDEPYLIEQARRLAQISAGLMTATFSYPDLIDWQAPRTQVDAVGEADGKTALAGLCWLEPLPEAEPIETPSAAWQWMASDFGASFLVKRRAELRATPQGNHPVRRGLQASPEPPAGGAPRDIALDVLDDAVSRAAAARRTSAERHPRRSDVSAQVAIDDVLRWVAAGNYSDEKVGRALKRVAQFGTLEQSIALTTALREQLRALSPQPTVRGRVDLLELSPVEFERLVQTLFVEMGFAEFDMRSRRDDGLDAVALRKGSPDGEVYLVQAKRFRRAVPSETVRALAGSVHARKAAGGVIVTTSWFGRASYEFAESVGNLELIDGRRLCDLLERHLGVSAAAAPPE